MFITKREGAAIALLPISCYLSSYYVFVSRNEQTLNLMLLFSVGVFFTFFRVLKEPEELMFCDAGTGYYWGEGYCLVPSIAPFLRNIGINFPWGLRNRRLEELWERTKEVYIHHHQDQRDLNYRVNVEATLFQANVNRLLESAGRWILGFEQGKPELYYQRLGFRIMLLALALGWGANTFLPKSSSGSAEISSRLTEVKPGDCVKIPKGVTARLGIWTMPIKFSDNINDVYHVESKDTWYKMHWSTTFRDKLSFTGKQVIRVKTIDGEGEVCF